MADGNPVTGEISHLSNSLEGDGNERVLEVDVAPLIFSESGSVSRARIVLHDVSDARQLEQIRKDFVANASHELRTPLTIINGYLETLVDDGVGDKDLAKRVLPVMQKHGERIAHIIEDMLTISKLESSNETLKKKRFDLKKCAKDVAARLAPVAEEQQAVIILDFETDAHSIIGDAFYWDQIFFNLVENALKENEAPDLTVTIAMLTEADQQVISVTDSGVGIPKAALAHVFNRFYRVDENRNADKKGTGLGLSIVKRAVEAHGGTIRVESTPGVETAFIMILPSGGI